MKGKLAVITITLSLVYGALAFLVTWNLYLGVAVFAIFALTGVIVISPMIVAYAVKTRKRHEAYRFVNGFLITLSVTKSPQKAFESGIGSDIGELSAIAATVEHCSIDERLDYLRSYFLEPYYPMFVSIFHLYEEQGGDPLKLGESLLKEATRSEQNDNAKAKESLSQLVEFVSLWLMSALIIVFVRVCLRTFYETLAKNFLYLGCAMAYFVIALCSFVLFASSFTEEKLKLGRDAHAKDLAKETEQ